MRRGIKQQMTAFNEFLEDKADGSMLTDKRGGKIYSSECARRELERRWEPACLLDPKRLGPVLAGTMDDEREVVEKNRLIEVLYAKQFAPVGTPPPSSTLKLRTDVVI